ncbi:MAG TPA: ABC transporter permease [Candidatus Limnocylindria bacterium]|jgi:putative ABC transport system permease protein|nr:ABC transporter permease [Candidatus Limnocylindria bacterium]
MFANIVRDFRYTIRSISKRPGFTIVAVLIFTLGIGANTTIFSLLYGMYLAPLPYRDSTGLVEVSMARVGQQRSRVGTSLLNLRDWLTATHSFEGFAAHRPQFFVALNIDGSSSEVHAWRLSSNALPLLGVPPLIGRWLVADEDNASGPRSVILSYPLWQQQFGGSDDVLGRRVRVDGEAFTIVGVMPNHFEFPPLMDRWKPVMWLSLNLPMEAAGNRSSHSLSVIGRLKAGVPLKEATLEMQTITRRLAVAFPKENAEWPNAKMSPLGEGSYVETFRSTLWLLLAAAGLVLLIACTNVAGLLIARGEAGAREFAIRRALGAPTHRLVSPVFAESCLITGAGCSLGLFLSFCFLPVFKALIRDAPRIDQVALRPAVFAFAAVVSFVAALLAGIFPALRLARRGAMSLHFSGGATPRQRLRKTLVTVEVGLAVVLLSAAGLLLESLWRVARVELGFRTERVLSVQVDLVKRRFGTATRVEAFRQELIERAQALPGVLFAATNSAPPMGAMSQNTDFEVEGVPGTQSASFSNVSSDYLRAMGISVIRGRNFSSADRPGSPAVVIISVSAARKISGEPLGKRIRLNRLNSPELFTIVGVARDVHDSPESPPAATMYALTNQLPESEQASDPARLIVLLVQTLGNPSNLGNGIRELVADIDRDQPVGNVETLRELLGDKLASRRWNTLMISLFAGLAISLTMVGVFGLVSYSITSRSTEIGVRMAVGASRANILLMFLREVLIFSLVGVSFGVIGSLFACRLLASMLYGVSPTATHILLSSVVSVTTATLLSALVASRRATASDPVVALRC